jgi:hypothetical protein
MMKNKLSAAVGSAKLEAEIKTNLAGLGYEF